MIRGKSKLEFATKLPFGWLGVVKNEYDSGKSYIESSSISSFSTIKSLTESLVCEIANRRRLHLCQEAKSMQEEK